MSFYGDKVQLGVICYHGYCYSTCTAVGGCWNVDLM